jgi:hypothetical protein
MGRDREGAHGGGEASKGEASPCDRVGQLPHLVE